MDGGGPTDWLIQNLIDLKSPNTTSTATMYHSATGQLLLSTISKTGKVGDGVFQH